MIFLKDNLFLYYFAGQGVCALAGPYSIYTLIMWRAGTELVWWVNLELPGCHSDLEVFSRLSWKCYIPLLKCPFAVRQYYAIIPVLLLIRKMLELCYELCNRLWCIPRFLSFCIAGPQDSCLSILSPVLHIHSPCLCCSCSVRLKQVCEALLKTRSGLIWIKKRSTFEIHITSV